MPRGIGPYGCDTANVRCGAFPRKTTYDPGGMDIIFGFQFIATVNEKPIHRTHGKALTLLYSIFNPHFVLI